jgi:hypothetical protein
MPKLALLTAGLVELVRIKALSKQIAPKRPIILNREKVPAGFS